MKTALIWGLALLFPLASARAADDKKKETGLQVDGQLSPDDPKDKVQTRSPHKVHTFKMASGAVYVIDLESDDFDAFLRLEDSSGKQLAFNDDRGDGTLHSRINFKAAKEDTYRIIVTSLDSKSGKYRLSVRAGSPLAAELETLKQKIEAKQQELFKEFQAAKTEEEKEKIKGRFFEMSSEALVPLQQFAEKHGKDPAAADARRMLNSVLQMTGMSDSPNVAKNLQQLFEQAKDKDVQGRAGIALAKNLSGQAGKEFARDKMAAAKLFEKAEALLAGLEKSHADVAGLEKQIKDSVFDLKNLAVGKTAMDIDGEDVDGKKLKLSDFRGKVVVLTFWGSWCPPCRAMIPHERELVKRLEKRPFAMLGVNSDRDREKAKKFIADEKMNWPSFWNGGGTEGPIASAWRVNSWPGIYVLDASGVIRYRDVRGEAMDRAVDQLLKELESNKK